MMSSPNSRNLREIMTDTPLEDKDHRKIKKPSFLLGDSIKAYEDYLLDSNYIRLCQIRG